MSRHSFLARRGSRHRFHLVEWILDQKVAGHSHDFCVPVILEDIPCQASHYCSPQCPHMGAAEDCFASSVVCTRSSWHCEGWRVGLALPCHHDCMSPCSMTQVGGLFNSRVLPSFSGGEARTVPSDCRIWGGGSVVPHGTFYLLECGF